MFQFLSLTSSLNSYLNSQINGPGGEPTTIGWLVMISYLLLPIIGLLLALALIWKIKAVIARHFVRGFFKRL